MQPVQDIGEIFRAYLPGQTEPGGAVAYPSAWCFTRTEVIVLDAGRDGSQVVVLLTGGELADAEHTSTLDSHLAQNFARGAGPLSEARLEFESPLVDSVCLEFKIVLAAR